MPDNVALRGERVALLALGEKAVDLLVLIVGKYDGELFAHEHDLTVDYCSCKRYGRFMLIEQVGTIIEIHQGDRGCSVTIGIGEPTVIESRHRSSKEYPSTFELQMPADTKPPPFGAKVRVRVELL